MATESFLLSSGISDNSSEWEIVEKCVDFLEDTVWGVDIFSKPFFTLVTESQMPVDLDVFMVSSDKEELV